MNTNDLKNETRKRNLENEFFFSVLVFDGSAMTSGINKES